MAYKRGDAVAIVATDIHSYITGPDRSSTRVDFGLVTSVTREGIIKAYRDAWGSIVTVRPLAFRGRFLSLPAGTDAAGLLAAASAHCWPGHPGQPKAFDNIAEARDFARPFVPVKS